MASCFSAKKILVVDDDPVILKVLSWDLERKGYEVLTAVDGPEAFTVVRQQKPDLILLDIFFPPDIFQSGNTWDAFLIMHWLQHMGESWGRHIPVIIISGAEPEEFRDRCLAAGAAACFQKPIKLPELLYAIRQSLRPRVSKVTFELPAVSDSERLRLAQRLMATHPSTP
jgi:two-component system alkaline phosphatase synthesis response regulator PhoP